MNHKASSLTSMGVSMALIAGVIWFLYSLYATPWSRFGGWHHGWMTGGGGMELIMLIFWLVVIASVVLLILGAASSRKPKYMENERLSAQGILEQRYARGEIDRETYEAMKKELKH